MRECLTHSLTQCSICKCAAHSKTDCLDAICSKIKESNIATEISRCSLLSQSSCVNASLSQSKRNSLQNCTSQGLNSATSSNSMVLSTPASIPHHPQPDVNIIAFLQEQNRSLTENNKILLDRIEDLTNQIKKQFEQLEALQAQLSNKNSSPPRKQLKTTNKASSLSKKRLVHDNNRYDLLSSSDVDDDNDDSMDLTLGSDASIFEISAQPPPKDPAQPPPKDPVVAKAAKAISQRKIRSQKKDDKATQPKLNQSNIPQPDSQTDKGKKGARPPPPIITAVDTDFPVLCHTLKNVDKSKWCSMALPQG